MMMTTLAVMGMAVTYFVATGAVSKTNELAREQAFGLVQAGFEYALMQANSGTNPNGHVRNLGQGQFSVQYQDTGLITITSSVNSMQGTASLSYSIQGPPIGSMKDCLIVDVSGANLSGGGTILQGLTVRNNCNGIINISGMTVTWNPAVGERMTGITIGGTAVYANPTGVTSGTAVTFGSPYAMSACGAAIAMSITFNSSMVGRNFTLLYTMSDSSSRSVFVQAITNQSACLTVVSSAADIGPPNNTNLISITLTNSCSVSITINGMAVTWSPSTGRNMTVINLDGANKWTGSVASPADVTFTSPLTMAAGSPSVPQQITFASDIRGVNYSLMRYKMGDGTNLDTSVALYETNMGACFSHNNAATYIPTGTRTDIVGQVWSNTCARRIMVSRESTNWTGLAGGARIRAIVVDGVTVFSGNGARNNLLTFSDYVTINGASAKTVTRYRFDRNIPSGSTFSHSLRFFDATSYNIPSYAPPIQ